MKYLVGIALLVIVVLVPVLVASLPVQADEPQSFPEEECQRYGVCELPNLLDPASSSYDPELAEMLKHVRKGITIPPPPLLE